MTASPLHDDPLVGELPTDDEGRKILGRCALSKKIGEGGFGAVYRGFDRHLQIDVAVKILTDRHADAITRFHQEARLAAVLSDPNLVRVYDVQEEVGLHYLVMELVDGTTLRNRVRRRGPLTLAQTLQVLDGAAKGLAAAHKRGIVHRDIKPDNIMLTRSGEVRVADLGIAKSHDFDAVTDRAHMIGTPKYTAPEQFSDARTATPATDVYALGATAYFALTGVHAIEGETYAEVRREVNAKRFPDILDRCPDLPDHFVKILKRCTARVPGDRYEDARALRRALRKIGKQLAAPAPEATDLSARIEAIPLAGTRRTRRPSRPRAAASRVPAVLVTVAVLAAAVTLMVMTRGGPAFLDSRSELARAIAAYTGTTGSIDIDAAHRLFESAADGEDPLAALWLARLHDGGRCGFDRDRSKASLLVSANWNIALTLAADRHTEAMFLVGSAMLDGVGGERNRDEGLALLRDAATAGHVGAMGELGRTRDDSARDDTRNWLERAANAGDARAMFALAEQLRDRGTSPDAIPWLRRAADRGLLPAMFEFGAALLRGTGTPRNTVDGVGWLERAGAAGHAEAGFLAGDARQRGIGMARDPVAARRLYELAVDNGSVAAQSRLGAILLAEGDAEAGAGLIRRAAIAGDVEAAFHLAALSFTRGERDAALRWLAAALKSEDLQSGELRGLSAGADIEVLLAIADLLTRSQDAANPRFAAGWIRSVADTGHAGAAHLYGCCARDGRGTGPDDEKAIAYLRRAAQDDHGKSMIALAALLFDGPHVDPAEALGWMEKAARLGEIDAMLELADRHLTGKGVARDAAKAMHWLEAAATAGDDAARGRAEHGTAVLQRAREVMALLESVPAGDADATLQTARLLVAAEPDWAGATALPAAIEAADRQHARRFQSSGARLESLQATAERVTSWSEATRALAALRATGLAETFPAEVAALTERLERWRPPALPDDVKKIMALLDDAEQLIDSITKGPRRAARPNIDRSQQLLEDAARLLDKLPAPSADHAASQARRVKMLGGMRHAARARIVRETKAIVARSDAINDFQAALSMPGELAIAELPAGAWAHYQIAILAAELARHHREQQALQPRLGAAKQEKYRAMADAAYRRLQEDYPEAQHENEKLAALAYRAILASK